MANIESIDQVILELYQAMGKFSFPIQPENLLPLLAKDCRILSYQKMAELNGCSVQEVAQMCKSSAGSTHWDLGQDRYLILYNENMNPGRVRWTIFHEMGHICLGHLEAIKENQDVLSEPEAHRQYQQFENEADYFTANLLAPIPAMWELDVSNAQTVQWRFGLSAQAAGIQFRRYWERCKSYYFDKTDWEKAMTRVIHRKYTGRIWREQPPKLPKTSRRSKVYWW